MKGEPVYHASLSLAVYRERLANEGVAVPRFVSDEPDCAKYSLLLAKKGGYDGMVVDVARVDDKLGAQQESRESP